MPDSLKSDDTTLGPSSTPDSSTIRAASTSPSSRAPPSVAPDRVHWYQKLSKSRSQEPKFPRGETWRDASLPDKERWKSWQKAQDKQQHQGSTAGYFTSFYKQKNSGGWWVGILG